MFKNILVVTAIGLLPMTALASGANIKTGIGEKNGTRCDPGFYWDATDQMCLAANWIFWVLCLWYQNPHFGVAIYVATPTFNLTHVLSIAC